MAIFLWLFEQMFSELLFFILSGLLIKIWKNKRDKKKGKKSIDFSKLKPITNKTEKEFKEWNNPKLNTEEKFKFHSLEEYKDFLSKEFPKYTISFGDYYGERVIVFKLNGNINQFKYDFNYLFDDYVDHETKIKELIKKSDQCAKDLEAFAIKQMREEIKRDTENKKIIETAVE